MEYYNNLVKIIKDDWIGADLSYLNILNIENLNVISKKIIDECLKKYNVNTLEILKEDTGILVLVFNSIVFKIYPKTKYEKIKSIINIDNPYIESNLNIIELQTFNKEILYLVINNKLLPLINNYDGKNKINKNLDNNIVNEDINNNNIDDHISKGLSVIHSLGYIHNDVTFDNIGVVKENETNYRYVLFDFGSSKLSNNFQNDYESYFKSKNYYN